MDRISLECWRLVVDAQFRRMAGRAVALPPVGARAGRILSRRGSHAGRGHEVSILIGFSEVERWRGEEPRAKISMVIMRAPQHGQVGENGFDAAGSRASRRRSCPGYPSAVPMSWMCWKGSAERSDSRRRSGSIRAPSSCHAISICGPINAASRSTSPGRESQPTMPSSSHSTASSGRNV
jgi:hypothetical protein